MTDTPKRVGPVVLTTANATLYTVPALTTMIVRSIHVTNNNTSSIFPFSLGINGTAATLANMFFSQMQVPPLGVVDWSGFLPLFAGDTLQALTNTTNVLVITISGIEVT